MMMLFGSSVLPATMFIAYVEVQLGDIVRRAQADSGLSVEDWNRLPPVQREYKLVDAIYKMREEAEARG
jgi:hypothetical protein